MREFKRIQRICEVLREKWEEVPDQRLGQFLVNYVFGRDYKSTAHIFHQEDDRTEKLLNRWGEVRKEMYKRECDARDIKNERT